MKLTTAQKDIAHRAMARINGLCMLVVNANIDLKDICAKVTRQEWTYIAVLVGIVPLCPVIDGIVGQMYGVDIVVKEEG